jgi:hypothetical protein
MPLPLCMMLPLALLLPLGMPLLLGMLIPSGHAATPAEGLQLGQSALKQIDLAHFNLFEGI